MTGFGKIFVVIAVLAVILIGIFIYLFAIDKKLARLKKEVEEKITHSKK